MGLHGGREVPIEGVGGGQARGGDDGVDVGAELDVQGEELALAVGETRNR